MLNQPTIEALKTLKLSGMVKALEEQLANPELRSLTFEERLGLLVDREYIDQENRLMSRRLQRAKLGQSAVLEDIDLRTNRGLEKSMVAGFASCNWIRDHRCVRMNPWKVGSKGIISISRGKSEGRPEGAKRPTAGDEPREFTSRGEGGRVPPFFEKLPQKLKMSM